MSEDKMDITFINTPGKPQLIKNRVCGITQADAALVVLDAVSGVSVGVKKILSELKNLGISDLTFVVNKLDLIHQDNSGVDQQQATYLRILSDLRRVMKDRWRDSMMPVPVSAKTGQNLKLDSPKLGWYQGLSLHSALKKIPLPTREFNKPLRVTIDAAYSVPGVGTVITGTVIQGVVNEGQYVKIGPINKIVRIRSLHLAVTHRPVTAGYPGNYIGINISGLHKSEVTCRRMGMITGFLKTKEKEKFLKGEPDVGTGNLKVQSPYYFKEHEETEEEKKIAELRALEAPLHPCRTFKAYINFANLKKDESIARGQQLTMHCHNSQVQVDLIKSKLISTFQTHKEIREKDYVDLIHGQPETPFAMLPREVIFYIFQMMSPSENFSILPQLSKDFLSLSTNKIFWDTINRRDGIKYIPVHPRNAWITASLTEKTREERIHANSQIIAELQPRGRPVGLDTVFSCAPLGRFLLRIGPHVVGHGMVLDTKLSGSAIESYWSV